MNADRIKSLISLLDDENSAIATKAMSALLSEGKKIEPFIADMQESSNKLLRRRVHQMQVILKSRKSRNILGRRFKNRHSGLWKGLIEIHLLWFDNDGEKNINCLYSSVLEKFKKLKGFDSLTIAIFMKSMGFVTPIPGDIDSDLCSLGQVLETKIGYDFMLCSIVHKLASYLGREFNFITKNSKILISCDDGQVIDPETWKIEIYNKDIHKICTTGELLKLATFQLFTGAVASDSYRYIYTIGSCISKTEGSSFMDNIKGKK
jgi:hypothetical protein